MQNIAYEVNKHIDDTTENEDAIKKVLLLNYIIRFDNQGFRLSSIEEVIKYFNDAKKVERVIFVLDSTESFISNQHTGKCIEIRLDAADINNCFINVQDDEKKWVDASFCTLVELLNKNKNITYLIRNNWTRFAIQILGVFTGFVLSLWVAKELSPLLELDYSLVVTFLIAFIILSNIWTFINPAILRKLNYLFPNIYFKRKIGIHWLAQHLVGALFVALFLYLVGLAFTFAISTLNLIIK